jgi:hypothetical protein
MEPYATAAQPGPLNGNRPPVNNGGNASFFNQYKTQILYGVAIVVVIVIAMMMFRRKRSSFYTEGGKNKKNTGEVKTLKTDNKKTMGREIETKPVKVVGPSPKTPKVPTAKKM